MYRQTKKQYPPVKLVWHIQYQPDVNHALHYGWDGAQTDSVYQP